MKEKYETPELHKILFSAETVITTSNGLDEGEEWKKNNVGDYEEMFG